MDEHSSEELDYRSSHPEEEEKPRYTPRPRSQIILAWVLLAVVIFAILGSCYWQIFGIF